MNVTAKLYLCTRQNNNNNLLNKIIIMRTSDVTTSVSADLLAKVQQNLKLPFNGHVGTHPVKFEGQTGLPCRVIVRVE